MFTKLQRTSSAIILSLICAALSNGQTIDQINSHSQPNQWNNMFGKLTAKQATLWAGAPLQSQTATVSPAQANAVMTSGAKTTNPTDPYAQYQQIGPTKVVHVGPATIQMGNQPPQIGPPSYNVKSLSPTALSQLAQYASQGVNVGALPNAENVARQIASKLPAPSKPKLGFGKRATNELQTAMRQLNPFTSRESSKGRATLPGPSTIAQNRDLFTAPVNTATQYANALAQAQQFAQSPATATPAIGNMPIQNVAMQPGASNSLFTPPPSPSVSVTAAATRAGFKSPPVIGTPLRVADTRGVGTLPAPSTISESPFGGATGSVQNPSVIQAPVEQMLPPPMQHQGQMLPPAPVQQLPIEPAAQQTYPATTHQAPASQISNFGHVPQTVTPQFVAPRTTQNQPNVQVVAPHTFSDAYTQALAQRDLNSFIQGSVNGFCPPTNPCSPVIPCPPANRTCGQPGCGSLCGCRPCSSPIWFQWETLLYKVDGYNTPALVTRSPAGTAPTDIGILGRQSTSTIFGGNTLGDGLRVGGRLTGGFWFDKCRKVGLQGELFALTGGDDDDFRTRFGGNSIVARPFFNEATGQQDAEILNMPGVALGEFDANFSSRIYSAAPALRFNLCCCGNQCDPCNPCSAQSQSRFDFLLGYRYFHVGETAQLYERFEPDNGLFADGTSYEFFDEYRTSNNFHGIELGFDWMRQRRRFYSQLTGTVALGQVNRRTEISGFSNFDVPGFSSGEFAGGFYSSAQEQGSTSDRGFAVLPQARIKIGYCITPSLRVFAGYDVLYLGSVVRPGSIIDTSIDPADLLVDQPAARRVQRDLPDDEFWMQGVSIGALWNF